MGLVRSLGARYDELDAAHRAIVRGAVEAHGGLVVRSEGDAFFIVFTDAVAAARAAVEIQRAMAGHPWPVGHRLRVRIGLHTGTAYPAGDDYGGFEVSRASRVAVTGWGGQIVLSEPVRALLSDSLPDGWSVRDLGRHRLRDVPSPEHLYQLEAPGLAAVFPPLRSTLTEFDHLPAPVTSFVGRDAELTTLEGLLAATRLLTLTGPGGTGKTRLAVELARRDSARHEDGAWFIDLQALRDATLVRAEVAHGVGLYDGPAGPAADRLLDYLADRDVLLVVDNFEQVLPAAGVVVDLLRVSPRSHVIVTSRVPLRVTGEQEYEVRPLSIGAPGDEDGSEAVRLFLERARLVRPGLVVDASDLRFVGEICRLVDGLPLAIELCAARVAAIPLRLIKQRLAEHMPLPGSGPRDLPERQRTIEATVAWSHDLLEPPLQTLFARLGVFAESFDLEQAEAVCGQPEELGIDVLDGLVRLAEHSLMSRLDDPSGGVRFGMLQAVRAFALDRLIERDELDEMSARHARAYALLAEQAGEHMAGADQARWLDRLESDDDNLRAATRQAIESGETEIALALVAGLWRYWLQTGRLAEGRELATAVMTLPGAEAPDTLRVRALDAAAGIAYWAGEVLEADRLYEEELGLAQQLGDHKGEALAWLDLYFTRRIKGDLDGSERAEEMARSLYRSLGDEDGLARVDVARLWTLPREADIDPSERRELEALASRFEAEPDPWLSRAAPVVRAFFSWQDGDVSRASRSIVHAVRANLEVREQVEAALLMQFFVAASLRLGIAEDGATVHGALVAAFDRLGIRAPATSDQMMGAEPLPPLVEALGEERFRALVEHGRRLSLAATVDLVESALDSTAMEGA